MNRRRTIVLGLVAAAAVTAAVVATLSGRSSETKAHRQVSAYIADANEIQSSMTLQLARVRAAFRQFADKPTGGAAQARQLAAAERTLRTLRSRLATLDPPQPAAKLHRLLVRLADAEVSVAHEVQGLAAFMPAFSAAVAASSDAATALGKALTAIPHPKATAVRGTPQEIAKAKAAFAAEADAAAAAQADALDVYRGAVSAVVARLRSLDPPAVMQPAYDAKLRSLVATGEAAKRLAAELRKSNRSRVAELNRQLAKATRIAASLDAQKAQIAAIKAYDARVRSTQSLQLQIRSELQRVQAAVG